MLKSVSFKKPDLCCLLLQNKHNVTGTGSDLGKSYVGFVRGNMDQVAKKINDDLFVLSTMEVRIFYLNKWAWDRIQGLTEKKALLTSKLVLDI